MARFYGTSKYWGDICAKLGTVQLKASHPNEIDALLQDCLSEYSQKYRQIHRNLETEAWELEMEFNQEKEKVSANVLSISDFSAMEIAQAEANLDLFKHDRNMLNFIRNMFRARRETRKITRLKAELQIKLQAIEAPLKIKENELKQKKSTIDENARQGCQAELSKIEMLKSISGSQELAAASAELEILEYLELLPDGFHVINNIDISVDKGLIIEGKWLVNGHIDHLVITPSGLFAIEVKNWTKQSLEKTSPSLSSPQIKFAAQLCYEIIKPSFPGVTVRSILAYRGHPPEFQNTGIVKVLSLSEVPAYIIWFKDNTLSNLAVNQLISRIQEINQV